jgi:hypothetical protein
MTDTRFDRAPGDRPILTGLERGSVYHFAGSPTRAAFVDLNVFSGWRPGNRAQSLGDES